MNIKKQAALIDEINLNNPDMCYLQMGNPTVNLEDRQISTPTEVMFQKCTLSLLSGTLNISGKQC